MYLGKIFVSHLINILKPNESPNVGIVKGLRIPDTIKLVAEVRAIRERLEYYYLSGLL